MIIYKWKQEESPVAKEFGLQEETYSLELPMGMLRVARREVGGAWRWFFVFTMSGAKMANWLEDPLLSPKEARDAALAAMDGACRDAYAVRLLFAEIATQRAARRVVHNILSFFRRKKPA